MYEEGYISEFSGEEFDSAMKELKRLPSIESKVDESIALVDSVKGYQQELKDAIQALPDGQAVSAQVAENTAILADKKQLVGQPITEITTILD